MTSPISGGLVSIEDGDKKTEEYAPARKVRVELKFDAEPGIDGQNRLEVVAAIADAQVNKLLGRKMIAALKQTIADVTATTLTEKLTIIPAEKLAKSPKAPKGEKSDKEKLAEAAGVAGADTTIINPEPQKQPAVEQDEFEALLNEGLPIAEVTDKQLIEGCQKMNVNPHMAPRIKEVMLAFCPREDKAGFKITDIAKEHRPRFLEKLKELPTD